MSTNRKALATHFLMLLRLLFCVLLAATGIAKLIDLPGFAAIVADYRVLPQALLAPAAYALTLTELALALWLACGRRQQQAALCLVLLHALYLIWLLAALARGLTLANCGCFGVFFPRPLSWYSPLEDAALLCLAYLLWRGARSTNKLTNQ